MKVHFLTVNSTILLQVRDANPDYDSLYMEGGMGAGVKDNNPVYGTN